MVSSESRSLVVVQQSPSSLSEIPIRSKAVAVFQQAVEQATTTPTETSTLAKTRAETMYSLSTRLASSLSDMFNVKVLAGALRADMMELLDALDELLRAINAQAAAALRITEGLRDKLRRRNQHAQQKARTIREKGEQVVSSLGERARSHVAHAQSRARALKEVITMDVADVYWKRHGREFVQKMRERQRRQSRKLRHGMRRMTKGRMGF
jgi:signal recognition particle GTPase